MNCLRKVSFFISSVRVRQVFLYNFVFLLVILISLDCLDSVDGKKGKRKYRPGLIVFNLDYTLWPFNLIEDRIHPPFKTKLSDYQVRDDTGSLFMLYPDVHKILKDLKKDCFELGAICHTSEVSTVEQLLDAFYIKSFFNTSLLEISTESKVKKLESLSERAGVQLGDILYFDSDPKDVETISKMNITTVLVGDEGITVKQVFKAIDNFNTTTVESVEEIPFSTTFEPSGTVTDKTN